MSEVPPIFQVPSVVPSTMKVHVVELVAAIENTCVPVAKTGDNPQEVVVGHKSVPVAIFQTSKNAVGLEPVHS